MGRQQVFGVLLLFGLLSASRLGAQAQPAQPAQPGQQNQSDLFGQGQNQGQGSEGASSAGSGPSNMVGDLSGGSFFRRIFTFPTTFTFQVTEVIPRPEQPALRRVLTFQVPGFFTQEVIEPLITRGAFRISENESPLPTHRVYTTYNYFDNVTLLPQPLSQPALVAPFQPTVPTGSSSGAFIDNSTLRLLDVTPTPGFQGRLNAVHREVFGIESPFLDGNASVGVRVPWVQQNGDPTLDSSHIGDVTVITKFALLNDRDGGNVFSVGLAVTAPTGMRLVTPDGHRITSTLLQPYLGYIVNFGQFYVQGFSSVVVPTDDQDTTLLCNDVGLAYRLYARGRCEDGLLRSVTPTLEGHLTTPLKNRGATHSPIGFPDVFITTGAVHVGLGQRSELTLGAAVPLTGPQLFDVEAIVQFNLRF